MSKLTLVIGNRNYSSWSLRPWLFMKLNDMAFDTQRIALFEAGSSEKLRAVSPTGKVPLLKDGDISVWDSLAICEYLLDEFPLRHGWPSERAHRAEARSLVAEMHSGFVPLRSQFPMNCRRAPAAISYDEAAARDIARIDALWTSCRQRFASGGPGLFGGWSLVDAFFAPVVFRFDRYCLPCSPESRAYMDAVLALPAMQEWVADARAETEVVAASEK